MMNKKNKDNKEKILIRFLAVSKYTTESNQTGDWRVFMPCLSSKIAPCQNACPIGQPIAELLNLVKQFKFREAWELLAVKNPLSGSTASVCQGFCQKECNRKEFDDFVAFNKVEKFLGKMAIEQGWEIPIEKARDVEEKKVAVIGAGPGGLTCAYQLARHGHLVTIFEKLLVPGGLMKTAIPGDRLSRDILDAEINRVLSMIYKIRYYGINEKRFPRIRKDFDAVFVAIGEHKPIKLGIDNEGTEGVIYGLDFLKKFNLGEPLGPKERATVIAAGERLEFKRRITIVGSGNTAIDCALCAIKIPDTKVFVFCEKSFDAIPDFLQKGIKVAEKRGVIFFFGVRVDKIERNKAGIKGINFTEVGQDIEKGRFTLRRNTDMLIVALGEERDPSFVPKYFAPRIANVFLGGNPNNVASAIASGNEGAKKIIAFLRGEKYIEQKEQEVVKPEDLKTAYLEEILEIPRNKKITDAKAAQDEAGRCLNCGTCVSCGICEQYCPDGSVKIPKDKPPEFNKDYCKGCGICAQVCPRGVIKMEKEEKE
jgi:NADPH-dependent glutamate synthase beta subunit-like oxidoreductase